VFIYSKNYRPGEGKHPAYYGNSHILRNSFFMGKALLLGMPFRTKPFVFYEPFIAFGGNPWFLTINVYLLLALLGYHLKVVTDEQRLF
jgi:hypothetical protein